MSEERPIVGLIYVVRDKESSISKKLLSPMCVNVIVGCIRRSQHNASDPSIYCPGRVVYFNSTDQYAESRNVFHEWYLRWVNFRLSCGLRLGFSGLRIRLI